MPFTAPVGAGLNPALEPHPDFPPSHVSQEHQQPPTDLLPLPSCIARPHHVNKCESSIVGVALVADRDSNQFAHPQGQTCVFALWDDGQNGTE